MLFNNIYITGGYIFMKRFNKKKLALLLSVIPIIILFIFFQKYFIEGMAGAVKG